jgi:hypothetical protein
MGEKRYFYIRASISLLSTQFLLLRWRRRLCPLSPAFRWSPILMSPHRSLTEPRPHSLPQVIHTLLGRLKPFSLDAQTRFALGPWFQQARRTKERPTQKWGSDPDYSQGTQCSRGKFSTGHSNSTSVPLMNTLAMSPSTKRSQLYTERIKLPWTSSNTVVPSFPLSRARHQVRWK